ncbi:hypothetical protein [uncultured Arcobacter sp.]|uniref:hypothetical protein n=1 Tax=uncultured Arcobacter sp. TaxID=165434 RepID=UPI00262AF623|nr:hypothetical protein [uncultured Arcobacter sp.]
MAENKGVRNTKNNTGVSKSDLDFLAENLIELNDSQTETTKTVQETNEYVNLLIDEMKLLKTFSKDSKNMESSLMSTMMGIADNIESQVSADEEDRVKAKISNNISLENVQYVKKTASAMDFLKGKILSPETVLSPKSIIGIGGLLADAPIFLLIGDAVDGLLKDFKKFKEENKSADDKNLAMLKGLKGKDSLSKDQMKTIMEQTAKLSSTDSDEIRKVLIQNGVNSEDIISDFMSTIQTAEDTAISQNAGMVDLLKSMDKSDEEIRSIFRNIESGEMLDDLKKDLIESQNTISQELKMIRDDNNATAFWDEDNKEKEIRDREEQLDLLRANVESIGKLTDSVTKENDSIFNHLFTLAGVLGLGFGAVVGKILLPFQVLFKGVSAIIKPIEMFTGLSKMILKPITMVTEVFSTLANTSSSLGKFLSAFKFGFKFLTIPLQIIMSVVDFVRGFMNTEGTVVDKIKGGLTQVVKGFIELPLKLIGWVVDWFLGLFGVNIEGGAGKAMLDSALGLFTGAINTLFNLANMVFGLITAPFRSAISVFTNIRDWFKGDKSFGGALSGIWQDLISIADNIKNLVVQWFGSAISKIPFIGKKIAEKIGYTAMSDNMDSNAIVDDATANQRLTQQAVRTELAGQETTQQEPTQNITNINNQTNRISNQDMSVRTDDYTLTRIGVFQFG